jgi:hypothetical protein
MIWLASIFYVFALKCPPFSVWEQYKNGCVHRDLLLPGPRVEGRAGGSPTGTRLHLHQALRPHDAGLTQAQVSISTMYLQEVFEPIGGTFGQFLLTIPDQAS